MLVSCDCKYRGIVGLQPRSPYQFAYQPSTRVSKTVWTSYFGHVISAATSTADCRNTLICVTTLPAPEAGDFVE